jgi:hypothetical protein
MTTGFIGLNNLKHTDYVNVVVQALAHVPPLRDFFLLASNTVGKTRSPLVLRFGELVRKMWSPHNFKNTVRRSDAAFLLPKRGVGASPFVLSCPSTD